MTITLVSLLQLFVWLLIGGLAWWAVIYILGMIGVTVAARVAQVVAVIISLVIIITWLTGGLPVFIHVG